MQSVLSSASSRAKPQFALAALLEFVTVCAILAALSARVGIAACVLLALMALALAAKRGTWALAMLAAASIMADWPFPVHSDADDLRQVLVLLIAGSLCAWYRIRRAKFGLE